MRTLTYPHARTLIHAVIEFLTDHQRGFTPLLMLLCWAAAKAAEFAWRVLRVDATAGGRISGAPALRRLRVLFLCSCFGRWQL